MARFRRVYLHPVNFRYRLFVVNLVLINEQRMKIITSVSVVVVLLQFSISMCKSDGFQLPFSRIKELGVRKAQDRRGARLLSQSISGLPAQPTTITILGNQDTSPVKSSFESKSIPYHSMKVDECLERLQVDRTKGLSTEIAT